MASAKITLIGFHRYTGGHIWDEMTLPEGVDKETLTNNIMLEYGECEVFYSDPDFMTNAIGIWSKKWYRTISRWVKALSADYEALWNIDRFEDVTDNSNATTDMTAHSELHGDTANDGWVKNDDSTESFRNTYNSNSYNATDKTINDSSGSDHSHSVTGSTGDDKSNTSQSSAMTHKGHYYGNGGVTSTQQLLGEEIEISRFNLYDEIAELFARDMLIDSFY